MSVFSYLTRLWHKKETKEIWQFFICCVFGKPIRFVGLRQLFCLWVWFPRGGVPLSSSQEGHQTQLLAVFSWRVHLTDFHKLRNQLDKWNSCYPITCRVGCSDASPRAPVCNCDACWDEVCQKLVFRPVCSDSCIRCSKSCVYSTIFRLVYLPFTDRTTRLDRFVFWLTWNVKLRTESKENADTRGWEAKTCESRTRKQ